MPQSTDWVAKDWRFMLAEICAALEIDASRIESVHITGEGALPSCYQVTDLAIASIAAAGLALGEWIHALGLTHGSRPTVTLDRRLASLWFGFTIQPIGWSLPDAWDPIAGDYRAADGWIKLHTNAPRHRSAALAVLRCVPTREAVAASVAGWRKDDLENAIVAAGGAAASLRPADDWRTHAQGLAVHAEPIIAIARSEADNPQARGPTWERNTHAFSASRPLGGVRVLDLTRVLAGPVATRFLAGFGADVLRIDPPDWNEPGVVPDVTLGKRCGRLDLRNASDRLCFDALLASADILVHGYRADALKTLGYDQAACQLIRPGLVDVALNAYGHSGPWRLRRGFDSLVQMSSGIAQAGMVWKNADRPVPLPVQALDQATGYLMAAAAIRGLVEQRRAGRGCVARLSLARTAKLLTDAGADPGSDARESPPIIRTPTDVSDTIEHTHWGPAYRLQSPISIDGVKLGWDRPAGELGSSAARWQAEHDE